ncbi:MAG: glycoside hydrolase family 3 N-terminal domain-containing protein [Cytophagaceae bacterium]
MKYKFVVLILLALSACKVEKAKKPAASPEARTEERKEEFVREIDYMDSLDYKIGQMILIGLGEKTRLDSNDVLLKEIRENKVGGIILFEKNLAAKDTKAKLKDLISTSQKEAAIPLFVSIDEEGGRVHRLKAKYGLINMPSAAWLGKTNNLDTTLYYTRQLASLMQELGINLNFAPDVDLATNKDNPVIAKLDRSYSDDPEVVSAQAISSIKAHHEYKIRTVLKHFPGHGSSTTDSHFGLTDVTNQWDPKELIPFKNIFESGEADAIMTAHIVNCKLDSTCLPATLSKSVITGILRDFMKFDGVIFSDDMQMYAISKNYGLENAIRLSILAGVDVLIFGNNVVLKQHNSASDIHAIIKKMVENGEISAQRIDESYRRVMALKNKKFN